MVDLKTSEEWQRQSSLLLQARPTTTRITTKYHIPNLESQKYQQSKKRKRNGQTESSEADKESSARAPKATLILKTYCPEAGVVLKYKTDRAQEVGRLVGNLGRLGRHMAALPEKAEDTTLEDAPAAEVPPGSDAANAAVPASQQPTSGGGGGKKKKKGKK